MTELVIHVAEELRVGDLEQLRATFSSLAPVLVDHLKAHKAEQTQNLVRIIVGAAAPKAMDLRRARMNVNAIKAIYRGTDWLTAAEVGVSLGQFAGSTPGNLAATVNRWRRHGEIFAVRYNGKIAIQAMPLELTGGHCRQSERYFSCFPESIPGDWPPGLKAPHPIWAEKNLARLSDRAAIRR